MPVVGSSIDSGLETCPYTTWIRTGWVLHRYLIGSLSSSPSCFCLCLLPSVVSNSDISPTKPRFFWWSSFFGSCYPVEMISLLYKLFQVCLHFGFVFYFLALFIYVHRVLRVAFQWGLLVLGLLSTISFHGLEISSTTSLYVAFAFGAFACRHFLLILVRFHGKNPQTPLYS